jgi:hypothetical protein
VVFPSSKSRRLKTFSKTVGVGGIIIITFYANGLLGVYNCKASSISKQ